jgi:hypothetical protein
MKKYFIAFIPVIVGIICWVAYSIIGSEVAPDGTLLEPFFLIPIGFLLIACGILIAVVIKVTSYFQRSGDAKCVDC